ncbi:ATP-binding protein [Thalassobaculum sp.]|uniref:ATP-binding protein n=1 Tax=Thalassobaculum sp. TaxID=2022740 RepID=UPI0032EE2F6E
MATVVGAAVLVSSFGLYQWQRYQEELTQAERSLRSTASLLAEHTARTFEVAKAVLRVVVNLHDEAAEQGYDRHTVHGFLKTVHGGSPVFKAIGWVDATGNRTASSLFADPPPLNVADQEQFRVHRDGTAAADQVYVPAPVFSNLLNAKILSVSMRLNDRGRGFGGIAGGVVDPDYFTGVFRGVETRPSDVMTLFRRDGMILARQPTDDALLGTSLAGRRFMTEIVASAPTGAFHAWGLSDGAERIIGYATVPGSGFIVTVASTYRELFAEFWRSFAFASGHLGLALFALVAGAWSLIRQTRRRDQLAADLRRSEARFRDLAESSSDWFWETDDQNRFIWLSASVEQASGVSPEWHYGKSRIDFSDQPQSVPGAWDNHLRCIEERRPFQDFEYLRRGPNDDRWIRTSGVPVFDETGRYRGYRGSGRDVTELRRAEERLRDAVESIPGGFLMFNPDGRLAYVNANSAKYVPEMAAMDRIGDTFEEILRRTLAERLIHDAHDDPEAWLAWRLERHRAANGSTLVHYEKRVVEVVEHPTREGGVIVLRFDVTERERAQEATLAAREAADNANRAKSEFLASMSHELRTPLNAVIGFGQLLQMPRGNALSQSQQEYCRHIVSSGQHLLALVDDVLDLAGIEAGQLKLSTERMAVADTLSGAVESIGAVAAKAGIAVELSLETTVSDVRADSQRLRQVLLNLLSNAIKYNRPGGSVSVSAREIEGTRVRILVADTGRGIPEDRASEIFTPFQRLGAEFTTIEGTGIGLSVCKLLVEAMDGRIGFESEPGRGSTFWIDLPVETAAALPEAAASAGSGTTINAPLANAGGYSLLYVEDNPLNLRLVEYLVETLPDVTMHSAASGQVGLELARAHRPDVIVLDLNLPEMNGFEILEQLRMHPDTKDIPVLALTASVMPNEVNDGLAAGFFRYLGKPINFDQFLAAIDAALRTRPVKPPEGGYQAAS